jgi:plasmid stability protein
MAKGALPRTEPADEGRRYSVARVSRGSLFKGSVAAVGALAGVAVGGAEWAASAGSGGSAATDREILTFGLLIERLQAALYAAALAGGKLTGEARQFAQVVGADEQAHVKYLSAALGPSAGTSPRFSFGDSATDPTKFIATAISLEETGLGVYNGQAVNLTPKTLAAAARVVSVEARHAAWARAIAGEQPAPVAVDVPITVAQAKQTFEPFIVA